MKTLRPHQERAIGLLKSSLAKGHRRPMVQAPTGMGKTVMAEHIVAGALAKGNRVCFVVPSISLIDQTVQSFYEAGIRDVGVIQGQHPLTDYSKPVQVASIQTIARRDYNRLAFNVIVVDEAHVLYKAMIEWMESWNKIPFIGLSATPWTKSLGKHYDDLIIASTTKELIDSGYLSNFRVFAPSHPDLTGVKTIAGDYHEGQLSEAMQRGSLVADIVSTWKARGEGRPTLVFCVDCAHAKNVHDQFNAAGIPCGYIDAYTEIEERQAIADRFHSGDLKVVANVGCLTTGVDWDVRCIVLARPTKSEILFTQIIGRGLRTADGKDDCLILDHSDTHLRLGFVTDITHQTLCDGSKPDSTTKEREEPLPKECTKCTYLKPAKVHQCPQCGFAPEKQSQIETEAGELKELEAGMGSEEKRQRKRNRDFSPDEKEIFFGSLKSIAHKRGYKSGWASNQYKSHFGVWPNAYRDARHCEPTQEAVNWVKSQQIRHAKRKPKPSQLDGVYYV